MISNVILPCDCDGLAKGACIFRLKRMLAKQVGWLPEGYVSMGAYTACDFLLLLSSVQSTTRMR